MPSPAPDTKLKCYHCGEDCPASPIMAGDKPFCCEGCKMVYQLLDKSGLCAFYQLNEKPGASQRVTVRKDKFAFLHDPSIAARLIQYKDERQTRVSFYLPQIHCSSCLYLLENLHRINPGIVRAKVNFPRKEVDIIFNQAEIPLQQVAELLTGIGYEPYISLNDMGRRRPRLKRQTIYQLGVAGFCFANIMLLSFPEYLGLAETEKDLQGVFRTINFFLALPVFFFSAMPFYESGWKGLQHKYLNIDAPIALAIIVTFLRSVYEVLAGTGGGYFDSMSGIVFFMLVGRVLQDRTHQQLSFERDYTSYFPIAVTVVKNNQPVPKPLPELNNGDTILIHHDELIPADGILTRGQAYIDYSFVTGESAPVTREMGEIIYAGGRQLGSNIEILLIKEVAQSYLTSLWSRDEFKKTNESRNQSFVQILSRYFTYIVFGIAAAAAIYWAFHDSSRIWNVITAVLIVACPCALLLSNNFTNGNVLRILGRNHFYLRGAQTIEDIANIDHIVFDKTGTLTSTQAQEVQYRGRSLAPAEESAIGAIAAQSQHPLSRALAKHFAASKMPSAITGFREWPGLGMEAYSAGKKIRLGSCAFVSGQSFKEGDNPEVHVAFNDSPAGHFSIRHPYRDSIPKLIADLSKDYHFSVISGDHDGETGKLRELLGNQAELLFNQQPAQKLEYIKQLQQKGFRVMMIGDGLNDAGALMQSHVGVAIAEDCNNFTPASDAIAAADQLSKFSRFLKLCKANKQIVMTAFMLSIVYNVIGLFFAVHGALSPITAAILMPSSSISIVLVTFGSSNLAAKYWRL